MLGDPCLAPRDDRVVHLPRPREPCERLLPGHVPVDQVELRHVHCRVHAGEPRGHVGAIGRGSEARQALALGPP